MSTAFESAHIDNNSLVSNSVHESVSKSSLKILVVDDSAMNRKMICRLFTKRGSTCDQAEDGLDGVNMMRKNLNNNESSHHHSPLEFTALSGSAPRYDVVLMDYQMPNMDGPTAIRQIREMGYSGLIFGVTGNALPSDMQEMISAGANDVLVKPFDMDKFWNAHSVALSGK